MNEAFGSRFAEALSWATMLHQNQLRKANYTPYIGHLLSVAALVIESGGSEDEAIAALLHDSIEDQGVSAQEIERRFGRNVRDWVVALTEFEDYPKSSWRDRKQAYLEQIKTAPIEAVLISIADKVHNARSLLESQQIFHDDLWPKFFGDRKHESQWFYESLLQIYVEKGLSRTWLYEQLKDCVDQIFDRTD